MTQDGEERKKGRGKEKNGKKIKQEEKERVEGKRERS